MKFRHLDKVAKLITDSTLEILRHARQGTNDAAMERLHFQLTRVLLAAGTSYRWGRRAPHKREFLNRLRVAHAEFEESLVWLKMVDEADPSPVWKKSLATVQTIHQILVASLARARSNQERNDHDE